MRTSTWLLGWADTFAHALHLHNTRLGRKVCDSHEAAVTRDFPEDVHA